MATSGWYARKLIQVFVKHITNIIFKTLCSYLVSL